MVTELGTGLGGGVKRCGSDDICPTGSEAEQSDAKRQKESDSDDTPAPSGKKKKANKRKASPSQQSIDLKRQNDIKEKTQSLIEAATSKAKSDSNSQATSSTAADQ